MISYALQQPLTRSLNKSRITYLCRLGQDHNSPGTAERDGGHLYQGRVRPHAPLSKQGAALFPLLERSRAGPVPADYWRRLLHLAAGYARSYPYYLKPLRGLTKPLTPTEGLVLQFLAQRKTNDQIARLLGIQPATVRTHLRNLYAKLEVSSREEARIAAARLHGET